MAKLITSDGGDSFNPVINIDNMYSFFKDERVNNAPNKYLITFYFTGQGAITWSFDTEEERDKNYETILSNNQ